MQKEVFSKPHKHQVEKEELKKYHANLKKKGRRLKAHSPIETFDSDNI
jgi:hypothetical protein